MAGGDRMRRGPQADVVQSCLSFISPLSAERLESRRFTSF